MFGEAKEFAGTIALGSPGVEVQAAYSFSNHIAAMINGQFLSGGTVYSDNSTTFKRKQNFGEVGIGYFYKGQDVRMEVFGGYGIGKSVSLNNYTFPVSTDQAIVYANLNRIFLQPSLSTNLANFNIIVTPRLSLVRFGNFTSDPFVTPQAIKPNDNWQFFFEPSVMTRFKIAGPLRGFFHIGVCGSLKTSYIKHAPVSSGIGLQIHTGQLRKDDD